jgi:hypothetical protein
MESTQPRECKSGFGLGNRDYGRTDPPRWPSHPASAKVDTNFGIVRLGTKATEILVIIIIINLCH